MSAPTCSLDAAQLEAQLERYRELARYAAGIDGASGVVVSFEEHPPVSLLQHTLEVERACCPFLRIAYDSERRRLAISIENEEHREALGALERARPRDRSAGGRRTGELLHRDDPQQLLRARRQGRMLWRDEGGTASALRMRYMTSTSHLPVSGRWLA